MARVELPVTGQEPAERADAARNRQRILCAAAELLAAQGAQAVTMNAVAHAAGIGVGTVYRRFGDVSRLLFALLDAEEHRFQAAFLTGPPPLGPGAPPAERLRAFLHAAADWTIRQCEIFRAAEKASPLARYHSGAYLTMHTHVCVLLREARPDRDPAILAHLLLAPFASSLFDHLTAERRLTADEIKAAIDDLVPI